MEKTGKGTRKLSRERQLLLERRLKRAAPDPPSRGSIPRRRNPGPAPLSFAQRQMWLIDRMMPGNPAYNLPFGYRFEGSLDANVLEAAFNEVVARHEVLRTTFEFKDDDAVQIPHPACRIRLNRVALEHLPGPEREARLKAIALEQAVLPFDLETLPLIRATLLTLGRQTHVLLVNLHHIVSDGVTATLLLAELDICYRALGRGEKPALPALPVQYADFST